MTFIESFCLWVIRSFHHLIAVQMSQRGSVRVTN